jgi:uncharacterized membrane protein YhhN
MAEVVGWDRARWLWLAALVGGASYFVAVAQHLDGPGIHLWKASGVALLAAWAAANARGRDGWLIAAVLALGALGDWLLAAMGLIEGSIAFAGGHVIAIGLYLAHRRASLTVSQKVLSFVTVPLAVATAWALTRGAAPGETGAAVGYTALVALMAATAWSSRFPRYRTGLGAMLFLASDLFLFAGEGGALPRAVTALLVWPLYFAAQALIAHGVVRTLAADRD